MTIPGRIAQLGYVSIALYFYLVFNGVAVYAHSPHDVIDAIALSPGYHKDETVFIAIEETLHRTTDGGASWKDLVNGLDNKFPFTSIAISPNFQIDKTLLAATSGSGIYRSRDSGASWVTTNSGLQNLSIRRIAIFISGDVSLCFAADTAGNLYRSENWGDTWRTVLDQVFVKSIGFSPDPQINYLLVGDSNGRLYLSQDRGESWRFFYQDRSWGNINDIVLSPAVGTDKTYFVGTQHAGVFKTSDGGVSFVAVNTGMPKQANIQSLAISPDYERNRTVFGSTWQNAVFQTNNGGDTWQKYDLGLTRNKQADTDIYRSAHFRDLRISNDHGNDHTLFLGGFDGLFKSTDGGRQWTQLEILTVGRIVDLALSPDLGNDFQIFITTYGGGAYATRNSELEWTIRNEGLSQTRLTGISFSPNFSEDRTVFSAARGHLLKSTKDSLAWQRINTRPGGFSAIKRRVLKKLRAMGLPESITTGLLTDAEKAILYPTVIAVSPNYAEDQLLYFGTRRNGLLAAAKGGHLTKIIQQQFGLVNSLALSPNFQFDRIIYVSARGKGIFRSTDSGKTWHSVNNEINYINEGNTGSDSKMLRLKEFDRLPYYDIKLTVSPAFKKDRTLFAAYGEGLYKSVDAGDTWHRLSLPTQNETDYILAVALSPNYAKKPTVLISVKGGGLYKSNNGGEQFFILNEALIKANHLIHHIEFSPNYSSDLTLYAASEEELFKSTNAGKTWRIISRLVRYENHRGVIDYRGSWERLRGPQYSAGNASYGYTENSTAGFHFVGTGIRLIGGRSQRLGGCKIYMDGEFAGHLNQYDVSEAESFFNYTIENLAYGPHYIMLEVQKRKQADPKAGGFIIDAFDVLGRHGNL